MKFKKILFAFALVFTVGIGSLFSGCDLTLTPYLSSTATQFNQTLTNTTPLSNNAISSRSDMVENYLTAMATVVIYYDNGESKSAYSFGSGVCVYQGGYIATNYHVIANVATDTLGKYSIKAEFLYNDEYTEADAELVWFSYDYDIAVIKTTFVNMPFVQMSDRWIDNTTNPLRIAEPVWTLGTPADLSLFGTYSEGTISSIFHHVSISGNRIYEDLIQHNASISNGSSGGGLFDENGYLIALNTLGLSSDSNADRNDLYFATPIYVLTKIMPKIALLTEDGDDDTFYYLPLLGVCGYDVYYTAYFVNNTFLGTGLCITSLVEGGAAEDASIPQSNIAIIGISTVNSLGKGQIGYYEIEDRNDLINTLVNFDSGDSIKIYYTTINADNLNNDLTYTATLTLG